MRFLKKHKISVCVIVILVIIAGAIGISSLVEEQSKTPINYRELLAAAEQTGSYELYLQAHDGAAYPEQEIVVYGGEFLEADEGFSYLEDYMNLGNSCVHTLEEGKVTYQAGLYNIQITYFPVEGKNNDIGRAIYINGEIPYENARYLEFSRIWQDAEAIIQDSRDNDVRPKQEEAPEWITSYCKDSDGFYTNALCFYLEEGMNTITIESTQEPMVIGQLVLKQEKSLLTYEEYQTINADAGYMCADVETIKVQGEHTAFKSNSTLYPISDRSSAVTEPQNAAKTRLNTIGGTNWHQNGQWISWEIEVPKDGLYEIAVKYRQNDNQGVTVVRSLMIDGEIPFEEASQLQFYYDNDWQMRRKRISFI